MQRTVYILGAGCSAGSPPDGPGYPLARDFVAALEAFESRISQRPATDGLQACVSRTIKALRRERTPTVDALVQKLVSKIYSGHLTIANERLWDGEILDAKIATSALFLDLEKQATATGLVRYQHFLGRLFHNESSWNSAGQKCRESVLSFNYDRLFEASFLERFHLNAHTHCLYGKSLLNSGFDYVTGNGISVDSDRFTFLKLHGSVGVRCRDDGKGDGPTYYTYFDGLPNAEDAAINDERFFSMTPQINLRDRIPEPLIVFPAEKPAVQGGSQTRLPYREYIPKIWAEARRRISEADAIWVIGYSFAPADYADAAALLKSAKRCETLYIQNRRDCVDEVCDRIQFDLIKSHGLSIQVKAHPHSF